MCSAQEAKVIKRREQEAKDEVIQKYYTQQRNTDAAATNALKDDFRRQDREVRERKAEVDMLESIYRVCYTHRVSRPGAISSQDPGTELYKTRAEY